MPPCISRRAPCGSLTLLWRPPQYGGHNIALEIQATLPNSPTVKRMMRGVHIAFVVTGIAYFAVALSGFHALGNKTGSNIIISLPNGPAWVRVVARLMVVVHVAAGYQVSPAGRLCACVSQQACRKPWLLRCACCMSTFTATYQARLVPPGAFAKVFAHPMFESMENTLVRRMSGGVKGVRIGYEGGSWVSRLVLRAIYVAICTLIACVVPFFGGACHLQQPCACSSQLAAGLACIMFDKALG